MRRAPEIWETSHPITALALSIVWQAHKDVKLGAKAARRYLRKKATPEERLEAFREIALCEADTAVEFFESPLWHTICELTDSGTVEFPESFERDLDVIRRAVRKIWRELEGRSQSGAPIFEKAP